MLGLIARWQIPPKWRRLLAGAAVLLALAAAGLLTYMKLVELGFVRYNRWDRRVRGTLQVGHQAPDLELTMYDGAPVRLSSLWARKPAILVFGSCT
jgi:hypothetical protein